MNNPTGGPSQSLMVTNSSAELSISGQEVYTDGYSNAEKEKSDDEKIDW